MGRENALRAFVRRVSLLLRSYTDISNIAHSFLLSLGVYTSFDPPEATLSEASGINGSGLIIGVYVDFAKRYARIYPDAMSIGRSD